MRILVLGMNYVPEKTAIGPLTADMCEYLAQRGHQVTMVTGFPHFPEWSVHDGYRGRFFQRETLSGVEVRRGYVFVPRKPSAIQRVLYDSSIAVTGAANLLGSPRFDVVVSVSPPLQLALTAMGAARWFGAPLLLVIKDVIPDIAINLGMLHSKWIIRMARALERFVYDRVDHISVISQGFVDNLLAKRVPAGKVSLIPDWVDTSVVYPMDRVNGFRQKHGIHESTIVCLYCGNISRKQGLGSIVLAAERLRDRSDLSVLLVGQGSSRAELELMVKERSLNNVTFLPFEPEETFPDMLAAADMLLLSQREDVRDAVLPSKLLKYMAAGRPVVASVHDDSETALCIRSAGCGLVVAPEDPSALARAICEIADQPDLQRELGRKARDFALAVFSRDRVLQSYEELLTRMAKGGVR